MLLIDDESRAALDGSRPADELVVWAWYDGQLAHPDPLGIASWSLQGSADPDTKVQQQLSLKVQDPDGTLSPWLFDDPLGVGGVELHVMYRIGGAGVVNRGRFRVQDNSPKESYRKYAVAEYGYRQADSPTAPHERNVMVPSGAVIDLNAVDLTANVDRDRLLAPESPKGTSPTVLGEFTRLIGDHFPTVVADGVLDRAVSKTLVYDRERLEACQDLLASISARYRMGGDGECEVYPLVPGVPVWRVEPTAGLVEVNRTQSLDGLYNMWVVAGKENAKGKPVRGSSSLTFGPLRNSGPHGRYPYFYSSEMITSAQQANEYAATLQAQHMAKLAVELEVTTIPRPEIQPGDSIEVGCPVAAGHVVYIPGEVVSKAESGSPIPTPTKFTVSCSYADLQAALAQTTFGQHLTREMPPLTWDRMPTSWGTTPNLTWNNLP